MSNKYNEGDVVVFKLLDYVFHGTIVETTKDDSGWYKHRIEDIFHNYFYVFELNGKFITQYNVEIFNSLYNRKPITLPIQPVVHHVIKDNQ